MVIQLICKEKINSGIISYYNNLFKEEGVDVRIIKKRKVNNGRGLPSNYTFERNKFIVSYNNILDSVNIYLKDSPGGALRNLINDILKIYFFYKIPDSLIFHASGLQLNNRGYLFLGPKGTGKSTLVSFFNTQNVINDDRVFLKKENNKISIKGLAFFGKIKSDKNNFLKLGGLFFISHGKKNKIDTIQDPMGYKNLFINSFTVTWDKNIILKKMEILDFVVKKIPMFYLSFEPSKDIKSYLLNFINNNMM